MDCGREREGSMGEKAKKQGKCQKKKDHKSSGGPFICGFGCLTCCTATAPSARKVWEMSSQFGSRHGRDLSLTGSCTERMGRASAVLLCRSF